MAVRAKLIPIAVACGVAGSLAAQESEAPELSFLEFLGSWGEEGDDVWFVVDGLLDDGYEVELYERVLDAPDAAVEADDRVVALQANDADEADNTVESGESNEGDGTDEVTAADAD
jgi:hypothetical protein